MSYTPQFSTRGPVLVCIAALAAGTLCSCDAHGPGTAAAELPAHDPNERLRPSLHRLYLDRPGVTSELAEEEMGFYGPYADSRGRYVIVYTTGEHVDIYAQTGIRVGRHSFPVDTSEGDIGRVRAELAECAQADPTVVPTETDLMRRYDDLVAELGALEGPGTIFGKIGMTFEGRDIVAIRFGPLEPIDDAPTLVLVSGQHARERVTVGVALGLSRWLRSVIDDPLSDPGMHSALVNSSILIVPSANPDGYEHTWTSRLWRGNRNTVECPQGGVDLNRNLPTSWQGTTDAQGTSTTCTSRGTYFGDTLQPENEALESLLSGATELGAVNGRALVNYHSFASLLLYPSGYKQSTDAMGPQCLMDGNVFGLSTEASFCTNPDFTLLRRLFGDTESGASFWQDYSSGSGVPVPFYRDHVAPVLYPVSGDLATHAQYAHEMLAVSPELPGFCRSFNIERVQDPDGTMMELVDQQKPLLTRVLTALPSLESLVPTSAYAPSALGTLGPALFAREYSEASFDMSATHGMFVIPLWKPADPGSLDVNISGNVYPMSPLRQGVHYNLYGLSSDSAAYEPSCPPCLLTFDAYEAGAAVPGCPADGCVDLCDPDRLPVTDFEHRPSNEWGTAACEYVAASDAATLTYPGGAAPPDSTACYFSFSAFGDEFAFVVERDGVEIYRSFPEAPYNTGITPGTSRQLATYFFEANGLLPSAVPSFTVRTVPPDRGSEPLRLYDPVIYCRFGALP